MLDFKGKKGIVIGVANERSLCWSITNLLLKQGANVAISCLENTKHRIEKLLQESNQEDNAFVFKCDVSSDDEINAFYEEVKKKFGSIDFIVCAPAFTNKCNLRGKYMDIIRSDFLQTMDISVFALTAICKTFYNIINNGSSILTLSYYGAEKIVKNYNVMGIAKSALEASVRYLAYDLGDKMIRVNSISSGMIKTLASSTIKGFNEMSKLSIKKSVLHNLLSAEDVANLALFLLSDLSKNITAENIHVDCGLNKIGLFLDEKEAEEE